MEMTFVLKVEGKTLTGSVMGGRGGDAALRDGVIKGDEISFTSAGPFGDAFYKGKVAGDTIAFSIVRPSMLRHLRNNTSRYTPAW